MTGVDPEVATKAATAIADAARTIIEWVIGTNLCKEGRRKRSREVYRLPAGSGAAGAIKCQRLSVALKVGNSSSHFHAVQAWTKSVQHDLDRREAPPFEERPRVMAGFEPDH